MLPVRHDIDQSVIVTVGISEELRWCSDEFNLSHCGPEEEPRNKESLEETQRARVFLSFKAGRSETMNFTRTHAIAGVEQGLQGTLYNTHSKDKQTEQQTTH